jgi:hypothetical protein
MSRGRRCMKVQYGTKESARTALNNLRETGVRRFYRCPFHNGQVVFHLTSEARP